MQIIHYLELLRYEWNLGPNFGLVLDIVLSEEACTAFCRLRLSFCIPLNSQTPGSPRIWGMLLALGSWLLALLRRMEHGDTGATTNMERRSASHFAVSWAATASVETWPARRLPSGR